MTGDLRVERRREVLKAIVRAYVAHGEPVGSRAIAGSPGCDYSSATLRAVMAELEEMGLLTHPHTSAGRVPTEKGYRLYADLVLRERELGKAAGPGGLPCPRLEAASALPQLLLAASRLLSESCGSIGVVLRPRMSEVRFRHAHFVRLDGARVVAVVVGEEGLVADRVLQVAEDFAQEELDRISSELVNRFRGSTLREVRRTLARELREERAAYDAARELWLRLALSCLDSCVSADEVYVDGPARAVETAGKGGLESVRQLLRAYEEKGRIARLLEECVEREGVQVHIGEEPAPGGEPRGLKGVALVAASYGEAGRPLGSIGVLGPTRMEYERVIAVVDGVARELGSALAVGFPAA